MIVFTLMVRNRISWIVAAFVLTCAGILRGQGQVQDATMKLRLAQSYEQSGDWEKAVPLYESLFQGAPRNLIYFDGLRRGYLQLKLYDKAIDLILYRLSNEKNPGLLAELGGAYYLKQDERKADSAWRSVINTDPKNPMMYRIVASQLMEFRLYDRAIQVFLEARKATGNRDQFAEDLATLYTAFQQYEEAIREYVAMLELHPDQLSSIQARMSGMVNRPEALKVAQRVVKDEITRRKENVPMRQLSAWLSMEGKNYDAALEEYRIIDRLTKAEGSALFDFARQAAQEQAYATAVRAYKEVLDQYPSSPKRPYARFGYARALEEIVASTDTLRPGVRGVGEWPVSEAPQEFGGVLRLYEALLQDFPRSEFAAQAFFRLGVVKLEYLFDLDGALTAFMNVRTTHPSHPLAAEASLRIGQVLTAKNNLPQAELEYAKLLGSQNADIVDHALVALAELDYFQGRYDSAETKLQTFSRNNANNLANNALQFLYFIRENKAVDPAALTAFAKADLLMRQRKYSEALVQFEECIKRYPRALLTDDAMMKTAEVQLLLKRPGEALQIFQNVVEMPLSILRDRALFRIGETYEMTLRDKGKAIEAYEQLLAKFPRSLYGNTARTRIRILRGDIL